MKFLETIICIISEDWFANSIGLIGGVLGALAFFFQLPKRLKPVIITNGDVEFIIQEKQNNGHHWATLESIQLSISITNQKNAYGIIEDIFIRVYSSDSFNPVADLYFPTKICIENYESVFTPIVLNPESLVNLRITFSESESGKSKKVIDENNSYIVDIYYKLRGKKKTICLPSIITFRSKDKKDNLLLLKNMTRVIERQKYSKKLGKLYSSNYDGILGYVIQDIKLAIKYKLFLNPKNTIKDFVLTIVYFFHTMFSNLIAVIVIKPIIIGQSKNPFKHRVTFGDPEKKPITQKHFQRLLKYTEDIVKQINKNIVTENCIIIEKTDKKMILRRKDKKLDIYMPGDTSIYAQVLESENTINLQFELKKNKIGLFYWIYNKKKISIYNMAILIINYFGFYSKC